MYICWEKRVEPYNNHKPMKKITAILALAAACLFAAQTASAIEDPNPKGTIVAGGHLGLVSLGINAFGDYVLVDSWWKGHFTVGGMVGLSFPSYLYYDYDAHGNLIRERRFSMDFALTPRATYGLNISKQFEVHVGSLLGVGYNGNATAPMLCIGGLTGCRYFFTEKMAASAELIGCDGYSWLNVGIALKF